MTIDYPFQDVLADHDVGPFLRQYMMDEDGEPGDDWLDTLEQCIEPVLRDFLTQASLTGQLSSTPDDIGEWNPFIQSWNEFVDEGAGSKSPVEMENRLNEIMEVLRMPSGPIFGPLHGVCRDMSECSARMMLAAHLRSGIFTIDDKKPDEPEQAPYCRFDFKGWKSEPPKPLDHSEEASQWSEFGEPNEIIQDSATFPSGDLIIADYIDIDFLLDHIETHTVHGIDGMVATSAVTHRSAIVPLEGGGFAIGNIESSDAPYIEQAHQVLMVIDRQSLREVLKTEDPTLTDADAQQLIEDFLSDNPRAVIFSVEPGEYHFYRGEDPFELLGEYAIEDGRLEGMDLHMVASPEELEFTLKAAQAPALGMS
ncbi:hypothetical protein [Salipiger sp. PrR003]|uniref:hypothetical protein n=1 Tax=Salipiger sp. PrR003 TaxID=2706776 RepID=UPI0013DB3692|nr:hypothetical protein [Salipiger sp. PrR003]NDV50606.1 hypothetical protein [Salipiger sp. PrR003]